MTAALKNKQLAVTRLQKKKSDQMKKKFSGPTIFLYATQAQTKKKPQKGTQDNQKNQKKPHKFTPFCFN